MNNKNILLTGGAGYIGSHTAVCLAQEGYNVIILDNFCNSSRLAVDYLQNILGKKIPIAEGDVRDTDFVLNTLKNYNITAVIHFAGFKAVGESVENPIDYYSNNVKGTISLLEAMKDAGVRNLVFSSSACVYGIPKYLPIDESHPRDAVNPYGRSKIHIEEILEDLTNYPNSDWRILCLRYFNPVGAHESGFIGDDPCEPHNLMPYLSQVFLGTRPYLKVFGNDYPTKDGTGVRDYIHVVDLAYGHIAALAYLKNHLGFCAINLGTGCGYSVFEVINAYERASKTKIPYVVTERRLGDIASCYSSADKAAKELNWSPKYTLQDMCLSVIKWQEKKKKR